MTDIPLFIHINSSAGRYLRSKFCEKYNENFIVHHVNPKLYLDKVPREKLVRCWKYRDPSQKHYTTEIEKYRNISIFNIPNTIPFIILCDPILRYKKENKNINEPWKDIRSHNIICKSIYIAITGDQNELFLEFDECKFNKLLNSIKDIIVLPIHKMSQLTNHFEFNSPPIYDENINNKYSNIDDKIIAKANYYDCKLYDLYK